MNEQEYYAKLYAQLNPQKSTTDPQKIKEHAFTLNKAIVLLNNANIKNYAQSSNLIQRYLFGIGNYLNPLIVENSGGLSPEELSLYVAYAKATIDFGRLEPYVKSKDVAIQLLSNVDKGLRFHINNPDVQAIKASFLDTTLSLDEYIKPNSSDFDNIIGYKNTKEKIMKQTRIKRILKNISYSSYIFEGPPGNGKTQFAMAIASMNNAKFIALTGADIFKTGYGESEKFIFNILNTCNEDTTTNYVIFFDELESVARKREMEGTTELQASITTMLLQCLEGTQLIMSPHITIIGATNFIASVDSALIRRLQPVITLSNPTRETRLEYFRKHASYFEENTQASLVNQTEGRSMATCKSLLEQIDNHVCEAYVPETIICNVQSGVNVFQKEHVGMGIVSTKDTTGMISITDENLNKILYTWDSTNELLNRIYEIQQTQFPILREFYLYPKTIDPDVIKELLETLY